MLRVHLLGQLRLFDGDQPLKFSAPRKTLPLWVYLLLHRAHATPRETVAFNLWPDETEAGARADLRRNLHLLQRELPPAPPQRPWWLAEANRLQWNPEADCWLDVAEFERLQAQPAQAAALYAGDLLHELKEPWLAPHRDRLRNLLLENLERLLAEASAAGDLAPAIGYAETLLQHDPLREAVVRELMALHGAAGNRAAARQAYGLFEARLQAGLGVAPSAQTQAVYRQVMGPAAAPRATAEPAPAAPPHNLPAALTTFIGREAELAEVRALLGDPQSPARLVTLTGPGGAGKTRLAQEAAAALLRAAPPVYPQGVFLALLADITDPQWVPAAIAAALGVREAGGQSLAESVKDFLRARQALLVLDNFEPLIAAAPFVAELLLEAPGLRVLATSRELLRVYGEYELAVPPLPLPDPARPPALAELGQLPPVRLFVERARTVAPQFSLTAENAAAVAEICVRLDGLPLAIELAAARVKLLSPQAMLARLANRLDFLGGRARGRGAAPRQQTLRNAIDWSYQLLPEGEQALFARLGVFAGGFASEAAEAVAAEAPAAGVLDSLASLADKSMLTLAAGPDGEPRFRLLFTLREFALEQLARRGELDRLRRAHADWCVALAEQGSVELFGPGQAAWLKRLELEHDNFRAALDWGQAAGQAELSLRLAAALGDFWIFRAHFFEGRRWLRLALEGSRDEPPLLRARALEKAGALAWSQADYGVSNELLLQAVALGREVGPEARGLLASALRHLGTLAWSQNEFDRAQPYLAESLQLEQELENSLGAARTLNVLGLIAFRQGHYAEAEAYYTDCLRLARALDNRRFIASLLNNLGIAAQEQAEFAKAQALLQESLDTYREIEDRQGEAISLNNLGNALRPTGELAAAEACYLESLRLYTELGNVLSVAAPAFGLGAVAHRRGQFGPARAYFRQSLTARWGARDKPGIFSALEGFAWLEADEGRPHAAARLLGVVDAAWETQGSRPRNPAYQAEHGAAVAAAQSRLAPAEFEAAWQAGRAVPLEQAVEEVLAA